MVLWRRVTQKHINAKMEVAGEKIGGENSAE
jgi:hypothetical protein